MVAEVLTGLKYLGLLGGGSIITLFFSKWLGKKKEDVELALDWQKFYNGHIETIKKIHEEEIESIKDLHKKQIEDIRRTFKAEIQELITEVKELKTDKEEADKLRLKWEEDSFKKTSIIKQKDEIISSQLMEIEELTGGAQ